MGFELTLWQSYLIFNDMVGIVGATTMFSQLNFLVARGRFEFGSIVDLPSAGFSSGGGDPEPSSGKVFWRQCYA